MSGKTRGYTDRSSADRDFAPSLLGGLSWKIMCTQHTKDGLSLFPCHLFAGAQSGHPGHRQRKLSDQPPPGQTSQNGSTSCTAPTPPPSLSIQYHVYRANIVIVSSLNANDTLISILTISFFLQSHSKSVHNAPFKARKSWLV